MKGQVSLEYMLVLAISLAALAFSVSALFGIKNSFEAQSRQILLSKSVERIAQAADEVCLLGGSNARTVDRLPASFSLAYLQDENQSNLLSMSMGNMTVSKRTKCAITLAQQDFSSSVFVENVDGQASIGQGNAD